MGELLRLVFVFAGIWLIIRLLKHHHVPERASQHPSRNHPLGDRPSGGVTMLRCAQCGIYVPADEAIEATGRVYCSREHAAKGRGS